MEPNIDVENVLLNTLFLLAVDIHMYICIYAYMNVYLYTYIYICLLCVFLCLGLLAYGFQCNVCIQDLCCFSGSASVSACVCPDICVALCLSGARTEWFWGCVFLIPEWN